MKADLGWSVKDMGQPFMNNGKLKIVQPRIRSCTGEDATSTADGDDTSTADMIPIQQTGSIPFWWTSQNY